MTTTNNGAFTLELCEPTPKPVGQASVDAAMREKRRKRAADDDAIDAYNRAMATGETEMAELAREGK